VSVDDVVLVAHAASTTALAGLAWTVQAVVYPGFRESGPSPSWPAVHAGHTRRITAVVAPPWAVQGLCVAFLLLRRPSLLVAVTAVLAAVTVASTVLVQVPLHERLSKAWDAAVAARLVRTNWLRTVAWTAGAGCALALLAAAPRP
jgi:hypothetical protein